MNSLAIVSTSPKRYKALPNIARPLLSATATTHPRAFLSRRGFHNSRPTNSSTTPSTPPNPNQHPENPSLPSFNLWSQIREARPAVRYTVYAGLGLMVTVESTFWFSVLKAKFFPSASQEEKQKNDQLLENISVAVKGYRKVWMRNYGRYHGAYLWGLGYGGLDGLGDQLQ